MPGAKDAAQKYSQGLNDIPAEVVYKHLLPYLSLETLAALSAVNRHFYSLAHDETSWFNFCKQDFAFVTDLLAPPPPSPSNPFYRRMFLGISRAEVYVWGATGNSRLGTLPSVGVALPQLDINGQSIDSPMPISIPAPTEHKYSADYPYDLIEPRASSLYNRANIVEIQAGGWSFTARDHRGRLFVWGQLHGSRPWSLGPTWSHPGHQVDNPTLLPIPCQAEAMSCGRSHLLVLDTDNLIWELTAWGKAYRHTAASLTAPLNRGSASRPHHIIQIAAGWEFSCCLTSSGKIYLWNPFTQDYREALTPDDEMHGAGGMDGSSKRFTLDGRVDGNVVRELPDVPDRPGRNDFGKKGLTDPATDLQDQWEAWEAERKLKGLDLGRKVVKIAAGATFIVALKENGEVWVTPGVGVAPIVNWVFLPWFSGLEINHITAQFDSFTAYGLGPQTSPFPTASPRSCVYHCPQYTRGTGGIDKNLRPEDLPELQNEGVIQIALGDYHSTALTHKGEMFTWGSGEHGQLGLGREKRGKIDRPERVIFPGDDDEELDPQEEGQAGVGTVLVEKRNKAFVFGITAAGWHTGALVLGSPKPKVKQRAMTAKSTVTETASGPRAGDSGAGAEQTPTQPPAAGPSGHPYTMPFYRVGFAGRGALFGRGRGRGAPPWRLSPGDRDRNNGDANTPN